LEFHHNPQAGASTLSHYRVSQTTTKYNETRIQKGKEKELIVVKDLGKGDTVV